MANDNPCRHCTRRKAECHVTCPDGIAWKKEQEIRREKINKARREQTRATSTIIELKEAVKRK